MNGYQSKTKPFFRGLLVQQQHRRQKQLWRRRQSRGALFKTRCSRLEHSARTLGEGGSLVPDANSHASDFAMAHAGLRDPCSPCFSGKQGSPGHSLYRGMLQRFLSLGVCFQKTIGGIPSRIFSCNEAGPGQTLEVGIFENSRTRRPAETVDGAVELSGKRDGVRFGARQQPNPTDGPSGGEQRR